jgi:predicted small metal-binding protein
MATQTRTKSIEARNAWQFECRKEDGSPEDCGFLLRDHDLPQLERMALTHIRETHKVEVPSTYPRSVAKEVKF